MALGSRELLRDFLTEIGPPERELRLLDIGGASSLYPAVLAEWGSVTVVEPDGECVETAKAVLGMDIRRGSLPDDLGVEGPFDVISMLDVLEHIEDDRRALAVVRSLLAPDGRLIITVPALQALYSDHDRALHHFRRYSQRTLVEAIEGAGLRVRRVSYWTSFLLPLLVAQRSLSKIRSALRPNPNPEYSVKLPGKTLNSILGATMTLERHLLRSMRMPLGSSLFAIVER
jgi:SAM-dependent methyltransferase